MNDNNVVLVTESEVKFPDSLKISDGELFIIPFADGVYKCYYGDGYEKAVTDISQSDMEDKSRILRYLVSKCDIVTVKNNSFYPTKRMLMYNMTGKYYAVQKEDHIRLEPVEE